MGTVFEAKDLRSGETVAVKVIAKRGQDKQNASLFSREQAFSQSLVVADPDEQSKSFFVEVIASDRSHASPYLVMECLVAPEWETLRSLIVRRRTLGENDIMELGIQLCRALGRLARQRIVHRDLKPENLFVRRDAPQVKIGDLGGAIHDATATHTVICNVPMVCTPGYMAPEHLHPETMTEAADVFSLAVILWECATGEPPFPALRFPIEPDAMTAWRDAIIHQQVRGGDRVSPDLRTVLLGMLAYDPANRPTARQVRRELETVRSASLLRRAHAEADRLMRHGQALFTSFGHPTTPHPGQLLAHRVDQVLHGIAQTNAQLSQQIQWLEGALAGRHLPEVEAEAARPVAAPPSPRDVRRRSTFRPVVIGFSVTVIPLLVWVLHGRSPDVARTPDVITRPSAHPAACDGSEDRCSHTAQLGQACVGGDFEACLEPYRRCPATQVAPGRP